MISQSSFGPSEAGQTLSVSEIRKILAQVDDKALARSLQSSNTASVRSSTRAKRIGTEELKRVASSSRESHHTLSIKSSTRVRGSVARNSSLGADEAEVEVAN